MSLRYVRSPEQEIAYWDRFNQGTNARRVLHRLLWPNLDIKEESKDHALCEGKIDRRIR